MNKNIYHFRGYHGIDADLETSLFEYGLICKQVIPKNAYKVIYAVEADSKGNYNLFESTWTTETQLNNLVLGNEWMDQDAINSFLDCQGTSLADWLDLPFISKLHDLVSYFGWMDVLGSVYYGFTINK